MKRRSLLALIGMAPVAVVASRFEIPNASQKTQVMRVEGLSRDSLFTGEATQTIATNLLDFQKGKPPVFG